ncbi:hypothetical protein Slin15195_G043860 [Septoria linicola]|uniref:Uncharacterized protein n=1 Tax=Septoria linicola TaxID=215465 RepID=A0A9Q9AKH2_9PEZI|nr:hypothetical protein Slin15195_G043860 [Septoria linicola]
MQQSFFERLPAELRNLCYEFALYEPAGARIWNEPNLLHTCKSIRLEAELMYYAINDFVTEIHEEHIGHDLCAWLKTKAGPRTRLIRSLSLHVQMPSLTEHTIDSGEADEEDDCGSVAFLQLLHIMESIRSAPFAIQSLEKVVNFTLNGARDDERFGKIEQMLPADQDRYQGAKFLILSLVHGESTTVDALDADDCREQLELLDQVIRTKRAAD